MSRARVARETLQSRKEKHPKRARAGGTALVLQPLVPSVPREDKQQDSEALGTMPPPHTCCVLHFNSQMKFFPSPSICEDSSQTTNQCTTVSYLLCSQLSKTM